jgi:glyoxalase family protein
VASPDSIRFWADRLGAEAVEVRHDGDRLLFADPEGLEHELRVDDSGDEPLTAEHRDVPRELALQGFDAVRAYADDPDRSTALLEDALGFERKGEGWEARGEHRRGLYVYDAAPEARGVQGAGSVHHVAWASSMEEHEEWRERVLRGGGRPTPVIDRFYFRSIYFREPSGVLFEIATIGPGFAADEDPEHLGERLSLPPAFEHLRDRVEGSLTPLPDTRQWRPAAAPAESQ